MNESIINEIDRILNVNGICESKQNDDFLWSLEKNPYLCAYT